jgi:ferredoxin-NADP reductase/MOSC domain-containing protein YiiM/ferredoxin
MRLLSVNVGTPQTVQWNGRAVTTAIFKRPVEGARFVAGINVEGDDQADRLAHGGEHRAVFVYQIESYRYWQEQLGRDDFGYGQFGENFTVEGLADDEVCVGDRYRIGSAVFEVTQPRVTCYRVGIRLEDPRMPSLLVAHRRPGFYMRVLEEGMVEAGQHIVKVGSGPEAMTVAEIDALLYLPRRSRRDLERALRIPALSDGWKGSFRELLERATGPVPLAEERPAWAGFRPFRVRCVSPESAEVISIVLEPADPEPAPPGAPGQFLTLRLRPNPETAPLTRNYSLSGPPTPGSYRISVKREPRGVASSFLHTSLSSGDLLDVAAPRGTFALQKGERPIVLISAGVGATPMMAMLHSLSAARSDREIWWVHGARNRAEHSFQEESERLLASLPRARRLVAYSAPATADSGFDLSGRLSWPELERAGVPADADFYICGPPAFTEELSAALAARGVTPDRVRTELFGPRNVYRSGLFDHVPKEPHPPAGPAGQGPFVLFSRSNLSVRWDPAFGSLLDLAEACDVPAGFGCRTGVCHACQTGLVSGDVDYQYDPLEPPPPGHVLLCCTQPSGDVALDL